MVMLYPQSEQLEPKAVAVGAHRLQQTTPDQVVQRGNNVLQRRRLTIAAECLLDVILGSSPSHSPHRSEHGKHDLLAGQRALPLDDELSDWGLDGILRTRSGLKDRKMAGAGI